MASSWLAGCQADPADDGQGGAGGDQSGSAQSVSGPTSGTGGNSSTQGSGGAGGVGGGGGAMPEGPPCVANGRDGYCMEASDCTFTDWAPVPGFCPGPASIQCCAPLPADGTCDPDAHPLVNAGISEPAGQGGCLPGMIRVAGFCIDRYEAFLETSDGQPVSPYFFPDDALPIVARSAPGAVPQGYINQVRAEEACLFAGKRLCTDSEWLRACRGPTTTTYPYGNSLELGRCNDHRSQHPAVEYFMTTDPWIYSELDHACLNQLDLGLASSGAFAMCQSAEGALDMMGNLHEWTADPNGTFRGGFYVDTVLNGPGCGYATTAHDVYHFDYSTGFRCCAD